MPAGVPNPVVLAYTTQAFVDAIILHPAISREELARMFGRTPSWVTMVRATDAFKEMMHRRQTELVDPVVRATLQERFEALTSRSLEVLQAKLEGPTATIDAAVALKTLELGAKGIGLGGFGAKAPQDTAPTPSGDRLDLLAERLKSFLGPRPARAPLEVVEEARVVGEG